MTSKLRARSHSILPFSLRTTVAGPLHSFRFSSDWKAKQFAAVTMSSADLNPGNASITQDTDLAANSERIPASTMQDVLSNVWRFSLSISTIHAAVYIYSVPSTFACRNAHDMKLMGPTESSRQGRFLHVLFLLALGPRSRSVSMLSSSFMITQAVT